METERVLRGPTSVLGSLLSRDHPAILLTITDTELELELMNIHICLVRVSIT